MKIFKIAIIVFIVIITISKNFAQPDNIKINHNKFNEQLQFFCDRDTYLPNDKIHFYIYYADKPYLPNAQWSNVVYVELITYNGEPLVKNKLKLEVDGVEGVLEIPENIPSGYYYIKTYTRWMRNYGVKTYEYRPIKIINYRTAESVEPPAKSYKPIFYLDSTDFLLANKKDVVFDNKDILRSSTLHAKVLSKNNNLKLFFVSVLPYNLFNAKNINVKPINSNSTFKMDFLPETRGITLSGILLSKKSGLPEANKKINISILDSINQSITTISDSAGLFYYSFNDSYGQKELLVTAGLATDSIEILVDNDFCNKTVSLPYIPFKLNNKVLNKYEKFIKTGIVENQYKTNTCSDTVYNNDFIEINYQKPDFELVLSDYIELPSLGDYFYELVPNVGIRKVNKRSTLQFFGSYSEFYIYKPLVLLDNVIIVDIDNLLRVSPKSIERIEVLEKPYAIANYIYGGVISITSKKGNLAKIELPSSGLFFNYKMFSKNSIANYNSKAIDNKPNIHNLLFWEVFNKNEIKQINSIPFSVGDIPGKYIIEVKKVLNNNTIIIDTALFIVK